MAVDIHKAGGLIIVNRKLLVTREYNKEVFTAPGGKIDEGESLTQALVRELKEELSIVVSANDLHHFGNFSAIAAGDHSKIVHMDVFVVEKWIGQIVPSTDIEEIKWVTTNDIGSVPIGSIYAYDVIPLLKSNDSID